MTIEPYENTLSVDELRRELRYYLDAHYGILHALRDSPQFPSPFVLMHLGTAGTYPGDWQRGKELQREHGLDVIPPKTECEIGAGLWDRIRRALEDRCGLCGLQPEPKDPCADTNCPAGLEDR
jgi:hypothetical protein